MDGLSNFIDLAWSLSISFPTILFIPYCCFAKVDDLKTFSMFLLCLKLHMLDLEQIFFYKSTTILSTVSPWTECIVDAQASIRGN